MNNIGFDNTIQFDKGKLEYLKKLYNQAKDEGKDKFWFMDVELNVPYAKYLIEYLETKFSMEE